MASLLFITFKQVKKENLMSIGGARVRSPSRPPSAPRIAKQSSDRLKWFNHAGINRWPAENHA